MIDWLAAVALVTGMFWLFCLGIRWLLSPDDEYRRMLEERGISTRAARRK